MSRRLFLFLFPLLTCVPSPEAAEQSIRFEGPDERVPVLELFTSQGCSSCPPADAWLSGLVRRPGLWREVIPLAFHVDYWDRIGWKDRFADPAYSERQRDYARSGALRNVYTPGFVLDGREWKGWFQGVEPDLAPGPAVGRLRLEAVGPGQPVRLTLVPGMAASGTPLTAYAAVLGFGISTPVAAGENQGKMLREDFVVLGVSRGSATQDLEWTLAWPRTVEVETSRRALVAWLSEQGDPRPVQAVGGWLP